MAHSKDSKSQLESLSSFEVYSIADDKWRTLESFAFPRQQCSACHFNERYIFMFGGKCLKPQARVGGPEPFNFVEQVEVYELEKKTWKTINYITEP